MCGRFTLTSTPEELARRFGLDAAPELVPRYNIAPGQQVLSIRDGGAAGRRVAVALRWGLVPTWAKDARVGFRLINARAETAAEKPAFRAAFRARRCLVPADGFYEWAPRGRAKQAVHIALRGGGAFGIAGLWERWLDASGEPLETCTLLTTEAAASLRGIHPRMPVILDPAAYAAWLDPAPRSADALRALLRPPPGVAFSLRPVSSRVNDARIDDPSCLAPAPEPARQEALL